jgi:hypothetical protein
LAGAPKDDRFLCTVRRNNVFSEIIDVSPALVARTYAHEQSSHADLSESAHDI